MNFWSLKTRFYLTMENHWFLDEKLQFETTDVKAMNFWSLKTRFYLTMENRWFLAEKLQIETTDDIFHRKVRTSVQRPNNHRFYMRCFKLEFLIKKPSDFHRKVKTSA